MTDLHARLVAAIQQVRDRMPHDPECLWDVLTVDRGGITLRACTCDWAARVDARLAVCVEAAIDAADQEGADAMNAAHLAHEYHGDSLEAGLAAFLAAAAQEGSA